MYVLNSGTKVYLLIVLIVKDRDSESCAIGEISLQLYRYTMRHYQDYV